jgi:multidrug resistance efflux pump
VVDQLVEEGETINQGDVIARLDTRLLEQEFANAESDLEVSEANLARALVGPSQAEIIQAENDLIAAQAIRPKTMAQATIQVTDIDSAQARLDHLNTLPLPEDVAKTQANVDRAQTKVDSAREYLEKSVLLAPIDGTVLEVFIHAFEYTGRGKPIVRLSDLNELSVEVLMDEIDVVGLSIGDEVTVTFEALPRTSAQAVITSITPNTDINDPRDFKVELKLLNVPNGLRWGMTAEVSFN